MGMTGPIELAEVRRLVLRPGDVLVVRLGPLVAPEVLRQVRLQVEQLLPDQKVVVLSPGVELEVISKSSEDGHPGEIGLGWV